MAVECGADVLSTGRAVSCVRVRVRPAQFSVGAGRVARLVSAELVGWPGDGGRRGCVGSWMRHCGPRPILPYRIDRRRVSAYFIVRPDFRQGEYHVRLHQNRSALVDSRILCARWHMAHRQRSRFAGVCCRARSLAQWPSGLTPLPPDRRGVAGQGETPTINHQPGRPPAGEASR